MKITKIEPYSAEKNSFLKVFADGGYVMSLAPEIVKKFRLCEGMEIDGEKLASLNREALVHRARERLLYSLDRRLHSEKELRQKLYRNYAPEVIDLAIESIEKLGLIDDKKFAEAFAESRLRTGKKGPRLIFQELLAKGVDRQIAKQAVDRLFNEQDNEIEAARHVARKYANELDTPRGKNRLYAALARRGFNYSTTKAVMQEFCDVFLEEYQE